MKTKFHPKSLWRRFKDLPWYWKALLFVAVVALIALSYFWLFLRGSEIDELSEEIIVGNKERIDKAVLSFEAGETKRIKQRKDLEEKRQEIIKERELINEGHKDIIESIDNAGTTDDLLSIADQLRRRGKK